MDILKFVIMTAPGRRFMTFPNMLHRAEIIGFMKMLTAGSGMQFMANLLLNADLYMKTARQFIAKTEMSKPFLLRQYGTTQRLQDTRRLREGSP